MKTEIDFHQIPFEYALCLNEQCPNADSCLRRLCVQHMPADKEYWNIVSPKRLAALKGDCPFYRSSRKVRYAKGFINMLDSLPYNKRKATISHLMGCFGQRTYYRVRKGERLLSPDEQQTVLNIIRQHHPDIIPKFDTYTEGYVW